ncbi:MAG TPA: hypothetical protein VIC32_05580 [Terriglobales bacterium]|jgi:hypothetical protein
MRKHFPTWLLSWLVLAPLAFTLSAGTLTGRFVTPGLGGVANGTLLLTLSQAAVLPGSFAIVPSTAACATSTDGAVVGVPNPAATPVGAATAGVGTLPAGTYFVVITYTGAAATTSLASPELILTLPTAGKLQINAPALQPAAATGFAVYIGAASGAETLQGAVTGFGGAYTQSAALASGAALPAANSTVCSFAFNDTLIPSFTYYSASLADAQGNTVPGYPQSWYLSGSSLDVSNIVPLASNPALRFPMPVLSNPASSAAQSVGSGLNLNQFPINAAANVGPGFFSAFWSGSQPATGTTLATWTPNVGIVIRRLDINAQTAGSGGTVGTTVTITDGTSTCTFGGLLIGDALATSQSLGVGNCSFGAAVSLTVAVSGDDHTVKPQNLSWSLELTAR